MLRSWIGIAALALLLPACGGKDKTKGPGAPGFLTATAGDSLVLLDWQEAPRAARYIIYIAQEPDITKENYQSLLGNARFDFEITDTEFQVDGLQNGTTYFFVVTSVNKNNYEGPESGEVQANPSPWGPPSVVESLAGEAIGLVGGVDDAGNLHAVWGRAEVVGRQAIHAARFDASIGGWGAIATLDSAFGISGTPSLAVLPAGDAFVAWRQGSGTDDQIWGADFDAVNGWDPPTLLTDSGSLAARNPAVAMAGDDIFALWTQNYLLGTAGTLTTGIFDKVAANGAAFGPTEQRDVMTTSTDRARIVAAANRGVAAWIQDDLVYWDIWDGTWAGATAPSTSTPGSASGRTRLRRVPIASASSNTASSARIGSRAR